MKRILSIGMIVVTLLAAFGASVMPLDYYTTVRGMQEAAKGTPGTFIYGNGQLTILCWQQKSGYGFAVVHEAAQLSDDLADFVNANKVNLKTMTDFVSWLEKTGYERMFPEMLPPATVASLRSYGLLTALGNKALPSLFVAPVMMFQGYPGEGRNE